MRSDTVVVIIWPMRNRAGLALATLLCILVSILQVNHAQDEAGPRILLTSPSSRTISGGEEKELRKKLELAKDVAINIVNIDNAASLVIDEASVRGAERQQPPGDTEPMINDHAMSVRIVVTNKSQDEVTGLAFRFTGKETNFYVYYKPISLKAGKSGAIVIKFMCISGEPSSLTIQLAGAERGAEKAWGEFPMPATAALPQGSQRNEDSRSTETPSSSTSGATVQQPVLLNSPRPLYTERARQNRIMGAAVLRVLIGEDGRVKRVVVIKSLPDFLTEEGIRAAFELKFKPAMKEGNAVKFWRLMLIDFNLK